MKKSDLIRAFIPGGLLPPRDLVKIIDIAEGMGNDVIHFGSRQDILFPGDEIDQIKLNKDFGSIKTDYEWREQNYQNIVTSYVAIDLMPTTPWVTTGAYYKVLDAFDHRPRLKVNITDPRQSLVPLFNGQLNFIASEHEDYWYLYLKLNPVEKLGKWPLLIYSLDIGKVSSAIENYCFNDQRQKEEVLLDELFGHINKSIEANNRTIDKDLELPGEPFPYYEGLNKMVGNTYWLGLYWRNNCYTTSFLRKVCDLCDRTNIGKIIITPWKSFIVKGISEEEREKWEFLCGINGINLRHSSLELNWHLPVLDDNALKLKQYLVNAFNRHDISTYGLTFSIKERPINLFTSIAILTYPGIRLFGKYHLQKRYCIYFSKNFDPNEESYVPFAMYLSRGELPGALIKLSRIFYEQMQKDKSGRTLSKADKGKHTLTVYQCKDCLTVYDERYGDPLYGIEKGTPFGGLPDNYYCPLCETSKDRFEPVELDLLQEPVCQKTRSHFHR